MNTCHRQTLRVSRNFVTSRCIIVLSGASFSRYAFLNASRTAANGFDAKQCPRMNRSSAREYTTFTPAQLVRHWRKQRPSNKGDLDCSVPGKVRRVYYTRADALLFSFLYRNTWLLGCVLNSTLCIYEWRTSATTQKAMREIRKKLAVTE
jgi:hypothetical protein